MSETDEPVMLGEEQRRLHRALVDGVLAIGSVPAIPELAGELGITTAAIGAGLRALADADYLALDAAGRVACLYPFSLTPTPHEVVVAGKRRFAMCAIDALGMPAMLGRELVIAGHCAICAAPIALRVRPGAIVAAAPAAAMVVARRDATEPAFAACCPFTVFACGQAHADLFMRRIAETHALSLDDALSHAEAIFGDLLADAIPARRPRGERWGQFRDDEF